MDSFVTVPLPLFLMMCPFWVPFVPSWIDKTDPNNVVRYVPGCEKKGVLFGWYD